jgi:hypothetical protein
MPWVRIDEHFPRHPKLADVGPLGLALQVAGLCYCNEYLTDGYIPRAVAHTLLNFDGLGLIGPHHSDALAGPGFDVEAHIVIGWMVDAELWDEVPGGYRIHDYHDYQPSKAEVLAERERKREAGRKGGSAPRRPRQEAQAKQAAKHGAKQEVEQLLSTTPSRTEAETKPVPVPVPVTESKTSVKKSSKAVEGTSRAREPLPFGKELCVSRLLGWIGQDGDQATPDVVRALAARLPEGSIAKVLESASQANGVKNRAGYVVGALKKEAA